IWVDALALLALEPTTLNTPYRDLNVFCRGELLAGLDGISASFDHWLLSQRTGVAERLELVLQRELEHSGQRGSQAQEFGRALADTRERLELLRASARRGELRQRKESVPPPAELQSGNRKDASSLAGLAGVASNAPSTSRDRLRLGVLPFLAHGAEREEDLAFSLSQEIAAGLARFRWFDVIAPIALQPAPSIRFIDEHQLRGRGIDYVVEGSMSSAGKNIHISVRLMDLAEHVRPVWSESFELARDELHRLDELVTTRI